MRLGTYYRYLVINKLNLPVPGKSILDVGCHDGFILSTIDADNKVGIDINCIEKFPGIQYIHGDFLKHDLGESSFDRVLAFDVIEHISEDAAFLIKIIKIISAHGVAIMSTPSEGIIIYPKFLQPWIDEKWGHSLRRGYSEESIKKLIDDQQAKCIRMEFIEWNCPVFRLFYLFLSFSWRISPWITKKMLRHIIAIDMRFKAGKNGYLFFNIHKL